MFLVDSICAIMGVSGSSPPDSLPRVEDLDQFKERFRQLFASLCLSQQEREWMQAAFAKFGSASTSELPPRTYWAEGDLVEFLKITMPPQLEREICVAGPLLYQFILRLGSFPYHKQPASVLTLDIALVAAVILLRRHEVNAGKMPVISGDSDDEAKEHLQQQEWLHRLLFQCMSVSHNDSGEQSTRGDDDDEHLLQAHQLVSAHNKERSRSNPTVMRFGAPIIPASELPSSNSRDSSGMIPRNEFKSLLKVLISCQLFLTGCGPEIVSRQTKLLEQVTESVYKSFLPAENDMCIIWENFNAVLSTAMPNLFSALPRLFSSFVRQENVDVRQFQAANQSDAAVLMKEGFSSTFQPAEVTSGVICNLSVQAQLATFLPNEVPWQTISILNSDSQVAKLQKYVGSGAQPLVLLVSGTTRETSKRALFGAFLPETKDQKASIFQLSPIQRVVSSKTRITTRYDKDGIHLRLVKESKPTGSQVVLESSSKSGSFSYDGVQIDFSVQAMEAVGFASGKSLADYPVDTTFYVERRPKMT